MDYIIKLYSGRYVDLSLNTQVEIKVTVLYYYTLVTPALHYTVTRF